ncbi:truncated transposase (plasmid) [Escherichia coli SE11]|uniref:Truncated transposase n=1 Tax=Escherichia coli (strain SE11) TaxID=409438 RepID=A0A979GK19_ECOSE|nr:truncated transposase [Escherichia coli SE11]
MLQHIDRLNSIAALGLPDGIALSVHQNRLLKLAREGRKMSSRDLAKFTDVRRYATLVCIITEARATLTDEVIDLHERILGSLFSRGKTHAGRTAPANGKAYSEQAEAVRYRRAGVT